MKYLFDKEFREYRKIWAQRTTAKDDGFYTNNVTSELKDFSFTIV